MLSASLFAAESPSFPILPALILVPFVGALAIALIPRSRPELHRQVAVLASLLTGILAAVVVVQFDTADPGFQFTVSQTWVESLDIKFFLGVDGISLFLVALTGVLFPIALFAAKPDHDVKGYYGWLTVLMGGCMGAFLALDLFLFFLMFEITLIPLYMLIGKWGHGRRVYAATKFFLFTMLGSAFMLVSIVALAVLAGAGDDGGVSFDFTKIIASDSLATNTGRWLFLGMAVAFAVKVPSFPFHTWLPDAHTEAPTAGSIDLAGILLKLGTYGFLRFGLELFPEATVWFAPVMLTLGAIGIIYGGIVAAMQKNLKRLVAYSSVAHMGFAVMGLFALNVEGIEGSVLQMVNHGISTGALFILLGFLYKRRHTYEIAKLKGIAKVAPVYAGIFTVVMMSSIGVPGLNGFVGEYLILLGTFISHRWWAVVAAAGVIVAALYLLWAYQRVFHGEPDEDNKLFPDLDLSERLVMVPLLFLIVFLGVYPKPVLDRIEPSVKRVVARMEAEVPGFTQPVTQDGRELEIVVEGDGAADDHSALAEESDR
ncbi:complex I subunit 4 family protein [Rhabdothermincola salaria]|uniref:complex I subunit 4 family protein n=1 Tax=Rhabdothermincola salaria TaxID=2903142 RepID=UPI001E3C6F40|nr:NADH-quinone oxidoreductase subunit M [Rhabdothermincola salaria]